MSSFKFTHCYGCNPVLLKKQSPFFIVEYMTAHTYMHTHINMYLLIREKFFRADVSAVKSH